MHERPDVVTTKPQVARTWGGLGQALLPGRLPNAEAAPAIRACRFELLSNNPIASARADADESTADMDWDRFNADCAAKAGVETRVTR
jgi:hypothetical protein